MAEQQNVQTMSEKEVGGPVGPHQAVSGTSNKVLLATLAGVVVGGPLLCMMGFSFVAAMALFLIASPVLVIFSPLLFGAAFVFLAALVGFGAAAAMAIAGLTAFSWVFRSFRGAATVKDVRWTESEVKDSNGGGYSFQQNPPENKANQIVVE